MTDTFTQTRRALHTVAELVMAGPQHRASGKIRLSVCPGGFQTVATPALSVVGTELVAGDQRQPITGNAADLGAAVGVEAGEPVDVYGHGSEFKLDDDLSVDPIAAQVISAALALGDTALRQFAPDEVPVLWPEHFDVAIRVDEINYGVSPGDGYFGQPYAYVGVDPVPDDQFWNAPFGVSRPMAEFADAAELVAFFAQARTAFGARDGR